MENTNDTSLEFMKIVNCSTVEGWSNIEHGLPIAAVFGTRGRYPKAVHVVSCQTMLDAVAGQRQAMMSMGIPESELKKAFEASLDVHMGLIANIDPETAETRETKYPNIASLDDLPEGRSTRDFLFLEAVPEPSIAA